MSFGRLGATNLTALLPRGIKDALVCYCLPNSEVLKESPDIITCHTNGCLYEVKNKKILRSLNLDQTITSASCYYLTENETVVIFYLIITSSCQLMIVRSCDKYLKIVKEYERVKGINVGDFQCLGFPQIKVIFSNDGGSSICKFPVEYDNEADSFRDLGVANSLIDVLQIINAHIDDLTEEYSQLRKIFFNNVPTNTEMIFINSFTFQLPLDEEVQHKLKVCSKWLKVSGSSLILGMKVCNSCTEIIKDMEITIGHKGIKDYSYCFFQSPIDFSDCLFSPRAIARSVQPGEEIFAVVTFEMPAFFSESEFVVPICVTCSDFPKLLLKDSFRINIQDIASRKTIGAEEQFTVEDLMALKVTKSETPLRIRAEYLQDNSMESILTSNLGFQKIQHVKDKLFYCTSTYLKEAFVGVRHVNPSVWKLVIFPSERSQLYFLVNALYDLLPERSTILYDEDDKLV